jgi:hypothetical protein
MVRDSICYATPLTFVKNFESSTFNLFFLHFSKVLDESFRRCGVHKDQNDALKTRAKRMIISMATMM